MYVYKVLKLWFHYALVILVGCLRWRLFSYISVIRTMEAALARGVITYTLWNDVPPRFHLTISVNSDKMIYLCQWDRSCTVTWGDELKNTGPNIPICDIPWILTVDLLYDIYRHKRLE